MDASTSVDIVTTSVSTLTGYFSYVLPLLIPTVIGVSILWAGLAWLRSLWNRRV